MAHNPIKSIKVDFHTADGVTPKQQPLPDATKTHGADAAPEKVPAPQSQLSPLEEALFPHWAQANGIDDPDAEDNHYDYRGVYKQSNGLVDHTGGIPRVASKFNAVMQGPSATDILAKHLQAQPQPQQPEQPQADPMQQLMQLLGQRGQ